MTEKTKQMIEASASVCLILATALEFELCGFVTFRRDHDKAQFACLCLEGKAPVVSALSFRFHFDLVKNENIGKFYYFLFVSQI